MSSLDVVTLPEILKKVVKFKNRNKQRYFLHRGQVTTTSEAAGAISSSSTLTLVTDLFSLAATSSLSLKHSSQDEWRQVKILGFLDPHLVKQKMQTVSAPEKRNQS